MISISQNKRLWANIDFVEAIPIRIAIITSLEKATEALHGNTGTHIYSEKAEYPYEPLALDSEVYDVNVN